MQALTISYDSVPHYIPREVLTKKGDVESFILKGFAGSPGIAVGPCTVVRDPEELGALQNGAILVCEIPSPALTQYMGLLRGMVSGQGGTLCIASACAREFEVPAVVGAADVMDSVHSGDIIRINGALGTVEILGRFQG